MDEAKQREEDRENNVKRYKKQDEQEKQREKNAKHDRHAGFIQYVSVNHSVFDALIMSSWLACVNSTFNNTHLFLL